MTDDYLQFIDEKVWEYLPSSKQRLPTEITVRCPICGDSAKSAIKKRGHYYFSSHRYFCFNCNVSLSGLKLLEILSGSSFEEIKTEYIRLKLKSNPSSSFKEKLNLALPSSALSTVNALTPKVKVDWKHPLTDTALEYLNKRKVLSAPFLKDKLYSYVDKRGIDYILIPWKVNGIESYYQINDYQRKDKLNRKYIFPKGLEKLLYGLDNIDISWPYIIIVEGVYDSVFVKNCVCSGGKHLTPFQLKLLKERYPHHQLVLGYDNDSAGLDSMKKIISTNPTDFKYFKWFDATTKEKDINDFILAKNDVNYFTDISRLEKMIISPIEMKMFLLNN